MSIWVLKHAWKLHHSAVDELCRQVHQESKALRPQFVTLGRRCCSLQLGAKAWCARKGEGNTVVRQLLRRSQILTTCCATTEASWALKSGFWVKVTRYTCLSTFKKAVVETFLRSYFSLLFYLIVCKNPNQWPEITWIMVCQMYWWIFSQGAFVTSFDVPCSQWFRITDLDLHHHEMHLWSFTC